MAYLQSYPSQYYEEEDSYEDYFSSSCHHGNPISGDCDSCDDEINARGGIDKCMNCGRYKYNDQMKYPGQVCASGCRNPNEY